MKSAVNHYRAYAGNASNPLFKTFPQTVDQINYGMFHTFHMFNTFNVLHFCFDWRLTSNDSLWTKLCQQGWAQLHWFKCGFICLSRLSSPIVCDLCTYCTIRITCLGAQYILVTSGFNAQFFTTISSSLLNTLLFSLLGSTGSTSQWCKVVITGTPYFATLGQFNFEYVDFSNSAIRRQEEVFVVYYNFCWRFFF